MFEKLFLVTEKELKNIHDSKPFVPYDELYDAFITCREEKIEKLIVKKWLKFKWSHAA